jgi:hypothetical protein
MGIGNEAVEKNKQADAAKERQGGPGIAGFDSTLSIQGVEVADH